MLKDQVSSKLRTYPFIDALCGLATLAVLFFHTAVVVQPGSRSLNILQAQGTRGVQLFYVASALTIFLSMRGRMNEPMAIRNFFLRRFFRIAPLFYVAMFFYVVEYGFGPRAGAPYGINGWHILWTAIFLNGWHPEMINSVVPVGWSIAVEMTFYLLAPMLFSRLKDMRHTLLLLLATLLLMTLSKRLLQPFVLAAYPDTQFFAKHYFYLWFFAQLPVFITGILVYQIFVKVADKPDRFMGIVLLAFFAFLSVAFLQVSTYASLFPDYILYGFAFAFLTLALTFYPTKLLVNPFTIWIGKLSYSIYLVHFGIAVLLFKSIGDSIPSGDINYFLVFILLTVITLPISWLTYTFVETPGIRLGKRIIRQLEQSQPNWPHQTGEPLLN